MKQWHLLKLVGKGEIQFNKWKMIKSHDEC